MTNLLSETNLSSTAAIAVNVRELGEDQAMGGLSNMAGVGNAFAENVVGLAANISLDSSSATVNATFFCKDAKTAEDAKKMMEAAQVAARNTLENAGRTSGDAADMIDSLKFSLSGTKIKGTMKASRDAILTLAK
jgi:hypothetical protein